MGQTRVRLTLCERFVGTLLGVMVADCCGASMQGWSGERVREALKLMEKLPADSTYRVLYEGMVGLLCGRYSNARYLYTDDTQMTIAVAESLVVKGRFDGAEMARYLADNFDAGRGYGPGIYAVLQQLKRGVPWNAVGQQVFGGQGSSCNGGAARVAPVALLYHDLDAANLRRVVELATGITHAHPIGMEGAVMQAAGIALALRLDSEAELDTAWFLDQLQTLVVPRLTLTHNMLRLVRELLARHASPQEVSKAMGGNDDAITSAGIALCAFLTHPFNFRDAVLYAIQLGGDTDTYAALTGALSGAFLGHRGIPQNWINVVENEAKGRDHLAQVALELFSVWQQSEKRTVPVK